MHTPVAAGPVLTDLSRRWFTSLPFCQVDPLRCNSWVKQSGIRVPDGGVCPDLRTAQRFSTPTSRRSLITLHGVLGRYPPLVAGVT